uniref:Dual-specificity kinase n=1 Tax=Opuntia streptacantha TaxID=393608 RepID=A0A7C9E586_OPUST
MANNNELNEEEFKDAVVSSSCQYTPGLVLQLEEADMGTKQSVVEMFTDHFLIDLDYLVIGPMISDGHYSIVYSGWYKSQPVAIKTVMPDNTAAVSPERRAKFAKEALMLSKVKHDNIVEFIGAAVEPTMVIVTELMGGGTLQKYLWGLRPNLLDLKLAIKFALDISCAMEYLHSIGVIHRDLKPANLLLTNDLKKIKVADFGLATEDTEREKTVEAGTYRWMAPELFNVEALRKGEKKYYDHKVDIYSFSLVLWELLTNETPFKGRNTMLVAYAVANNLRPSVENIPQSIVPLLVSCWSEDPTNRPEFSEIRAFLEKFHQSLCSEESKPISIEQNEEGGDEVGNSERAECEINKTIKTRMRKPGCLLRCLSCSYN